MDGLSSIVKRNGGNCAVYYEIDVLFTEDGSRDPGKVRNVVSPDVIVVCDVSKIDDAAGCWGAPDLVVEIQSPHTSRYDLTVKYDLYARFGVREYWVVYPLDGCIRVYRLENGSYGEGELYERGVVPVGIFGEASLELSGIFDRR
jgi:Uma2 family endonuclease